MYTFDNLSFRYRDYLFEDFTHVIPEPRIGIVGRNGSGKTTLLRLFDQQIFPQSGRIEAAGSTYLVDFDLRRYRSFTIRDMVDLCRPLKSFDTSQAARFIGELLLDDYIDIPLGELSKGTAKKVSLLLGLMATADVLLVDEPYESIDAESNANLIEVMRRQERGLVVVSHDLDHLEATVDVVYRVDDRKLVRQ